MTRGQVDAGGGRRDGGPVGAEARRTAQSSSPPRSRGDSVLRAGAGSPGKPGAESTGATSKTAGGLKKRALINIGKRMSEAGPI